MDILTVISAIPNPAPDAPPGVAQAVGVVALVGAGVVSGAVASRSTGRPECRFGWAGFSRMPPQRACRSPDTFIRNRDGKLLARRRPAPASWFSEAARRRRLDDTPIGDLPHPVPRSSVPTTRFATYLPQAPATSHLWPLTAGLTKIHHSIR
jgi:hypothetical protein